MFDNLESYLKHKHHCGKLVYPISGSMSPWHVTEELRKMHPNVYGKYVCTCGLDAIKKELGYAQ